MPRQPRVVIPGWPHHVTQRGNHSQAVFDRRGDGKIYLRLLQRQCAATGTLVLGYCLMPNHVHLILVPSREEALARALGQTHYEYALYRNARQSQSGHVWQGRFSSCPMEAQHLWHALRYVEQNPVRAGLAEKPQDWRWSSAASHCGVDVAPLWLDRREWNARWTAGSWDEFLGRTDAPFDERVRHATSRGEKLAAVERAVEDQNTVSLLVDGR